MATDTATATAPAPVIVAALVTRQRVRAGQESQGQGRAEQRVQGREDRQVLAWHTHVNVYRMSSVAAKAVVRKETTYRDCYQLPAPSCKLPVAS